MSTFCKLACWERPSNLGIVYAVLKPTITITSNKTIASQVLALSKSWRLFRLIVCFLAHYVLVLALLELVNVHLFEVWIINVRAVVLNVFS